MRQAVPEKREVLGDVGVLETFGEDRCKPPRDTMHRIIQVEAPMSRNLRNMLNSAQESSLLPRGTCAQEGKASRFIGINHMNILNIYGIHSAQSGESGLNDRASGS